MSQLYAKHSCVKEDHWIVGMVKNKKFLKEI